MTRTLLLAVLILAVVVMGGCAASVNAGDGTVTTKDGRTLTGDIWMDPNDTGGGVTIHVPNARYHFAFGEIDTIKIEKAE